MVGGCFRLQGDIAFRGTDWVWFEISRVACRGGGMVPGCAARSRNWVWFEMVRISDSTRHRAARGIGFGLKFCAWRAATAGCCPVVQRGAEIGFGLKCAGSRFDGAIAPHRNWVWF